MDRVIKWTCFILALGVCCQAFPQQRFTFSDYNLMRLFSVVKYRKEPFIEVHYFPLLKKGKKTTGELLYIRPHKLAAMVVSPKKEVIIYKDGLAKYYDQLPTEGQAIQPTKVQPMRRHSNIYAPMLIYSMMMTGNYRYLNNNFTAILRGDFSKWVMQLNPQTSYYSESISSIYINGKDNHVQRIIVILKNNSQLRLIVGKPWWQL